MAGTRIAHRVLMVGGVALAVAVAVIGTTGRTDRRSSAAVADASATPSFVRGSAGPTVPSTPAGSAPRPARTPAPAYVDRGGGYWFTGMDTYTRMNGWFATHCAYDFCPEAVRVIVAEPKDGISVVLNDEASVTIRGEMIDELRSSWQKAVDGSPPTEIIIDGQPAFLASDGTRTSWAFVPFGGRLYAFNGSSMFATGGRDIIRNFVHGFHFLMPDCWLLPCPDGRDPEGGGHAVASFDAARADGRWTEQETHVLGSNDPGSTRQWRVSCGDTCEGQLALSIGTTGTGALVPSSPKSSGLTGFPGVAASPRIAGTTLAELEASWDLAFGETTFTPVTVDGKAGITTINTRLPKVVLLIDGGYVLVLMAVGEITWDPAPGIPYEQFVRGLSFIR